MSRVVWKYPLETLTIVSVPITAVPVLIAIDPANGRPAIWIEIDQDAPKVERMFCIFGTGHRIEGDGGYPSPIHIGSVVDGGYVWHAYELRASPRDPGGTAGGEG